MSTSPQTEALQAAVSALSPLQLADGSYLSLEGALAVVAPLLFPTGIQDEAAYDFLQTVTLALCADLGYAEEVDLTPPTVPLGASGTYLKQLPPVSDDLLAEALAYSVARHARALRTPHEALPRDYLLRTLAPRVFDCTLAALSPAQVRYLTHLADRIASAQGWTREETPPPTWSPAGARYTRPLVPDLDALHRALAREVERGTTRLDHLRAVGLRAAFAPGISEDPDELLPAEAWRRCFDELGLIYDPTATHLRPKPLALPADALARLHSGIAALPTYQHRTHGRTLLKATVLAATCQALSLPTEVFATPAGQALLTEGLLARTLIGLGYQVPALWCYQSDFDPAPPQSDEFFPQALHVPPAHTMLDLALGFPVACPALVRDDETLVYLELVGPRQAVLANWAALRTANRTHTVAGARLTTGKEDGLLTLKTTLPCGWDHWCLLHQQTSCDRLHPTRPCYLLDDGQHPIPPGFYPLLAQVLAVPVLPEWMDYLWVQGRLAGLLTPLTKGCLGLGGWRLHPAETAWQKIVSAGLAQGELHF